MTALLHPPDRRRAGTTGRPPLRVLDRAAPARSRYDRRHLRLVAGGLLFAAMLAGNVAVHAQTTQGQFELDRLQTTASQRQARYQQLRLQVAELEAPQRVVARARQLGMVEPDRVTYLTPTASTLAGGPVAGQSPPPASTPEAQAARSWAAVKPHLDGRR